jgi:RHS repeat-associated protein
MIYTLRHDSLFLDELYIYGSQRIGLSKENRYLARKPLTPTPFAFNPNIKDPLSGSQPVQPQPLTLYTKRYELTDWLGNVRVVITNKKIPLQSAPLSYRPDVVSVTDYYAFGSEVRERTYEKVDYDYGFNGQIEDNEVTGINGSHLAFEYRIYDSRLGKFLSVDPLMTSYPWNSTYAFAENRVIDGVDLEGREWQPTDDKGNSVEPDANNISAYTWVGFESYTYFDVGPYSNSPRTYGTLNELYDAEGRMASGTIIGNAPAGTVSSAALVDYRTSFSVTQDNFYGFSQIQIVDEGAIFFSVDANFQPIQEWALKTENRLDFNGSMATYSNKQYANGQLVLSSVYSNGKAISNYTWEAISGPWGNGSLENGRYTVNNLRDNRTGSYANFGVGFSFDINPLFSTGRFDLRVHPDGGPFGTLGCIGLTGNANELRKAKQKLNSLITKYGHINLNVSILENPNNNGY